MKRSFVHVVLPVSLYRTVTRVVLKPFKFMQCPWTSFYRTVTRVVLKLDNVIITIGRNFYRTVTRVVLKPEQDKNQ